MDVNVQSHGWATIQDGDIDRMAMSPNGEWLAVIAFRYSAQAGNIGCRLEIYHLSNGTCTLARRASFPFIDEQHPGAAPRASLFFTADSSLLVAMVSKGSPSGEVSAWQTGGDCPRLNSVMHNIFGAAIDVCPSTVDATKVCVLERAQRNAHTVEYAVRTATVDWSSASVQYDDHDIVPWGQYMYMSSGSRVMLSPGDVYAVIQNGDATRLVRRDTGTETILYGANSCTWLPGDANTVFVDEQAGRHVIGTLIRKVSLVGAVVYDPYADLDAPSLVDHMEALSPHTLCLCANVNPFATYDEDENVDDTSGGIWLVNYVTRQRLGLYTDSGTATENAFPAEDSDLSMDSSASANISDASTEMDPPPANNNDSAAGNDDGQPPPLMDEDDDDDDQQPSEDDNEEVEPDDFKTWCMTRVAANGLIACSYYDRQSHPPSTEIKVFKLEDLYRTPVAVLPLSDVAAG